MTLGERLHKFDYIVSLDNCMMPDLDYTNLGIGNLTSEECERWDYARDWFPETVVSQFNLVCQNEFWIVLSQSIYMFGYVVGSASSGILSDKFGRKRIILISTAGYFLFGVSVVFSPTIYVFNILRWCTAVCAISVFNVSFTYSAEVVSGKWSTFVGLFFGVTCALGLMCVPAFSWLFPRWTSLQLALTVPILVVFAGPLAFLLFPESPRWLIAHGLVQEAETAMDQIAEANGKEYRRDCTNSLIALSESYAMDNVSICDLFKTPGICRSTFLLYYIWFCFISIYNCLILNTKSLIPGNMSVNIEILGSLEVLASFLILPILSYVPRRISVCLCMICTGSSFLACTFAKEEQLKQIFAQVGQFSNTVCLWIMFVYTAEIYPTAIRNMGLGTSNAIGRLGASLAPLLVSPGEDQGVILSVFGVLTLAGGFLVLLLPETLNRSLDNTIEEGEMFNKNFGGFRCLGKIEDEETTMVLQDKK